MSTDCVFCKIAAGEIPAGIVYRDERVTAFKDLHPAAPTHILIIPNRHLDSVNAVTPADEPDLGHMVWVAGQIAREMGIAQNGYRLVTNTGPDAGQIVRHLHFHLLGGIRLTDALA